MESERLRAIVDELARARPGGGLRPGHYDKP